MTVLDSLSDQCAQIRQWIQDEANFFRLHLVYFSFVPLIAAGVFYAVNGEFHIRECLVFERDMILGWLARYCQSTLQSLNTEGVQL